MNFCKNCQFLTEYGVSRENQKYIETLIGWNDKEEMLEQIDIYDYNIQKL